MRVGYTERMRGVVMLGVAAACGRSGFDARPTSDGPRVGASYVEVVTAAAPVAYWRLGEAVPSIAFDAGPNAWHGTYDASAQLGAPGALEGDTDSAVELDGSTTGVAMPDILDFSGLLPYSLEVWARPRTIDSLSRAFCGKKSTALIGYSMFVNDMGTGFGRYDVNQAISEVYAAGLALDVYSHVVGTFDGTALRLYVNGVEVGNALNTISLPDGTVGFAIGAKGDGTPGYFDGSLDEVAVYDRALSPAEVAAHFAAR